MQIFSYPTWGNAQNVQIEPPRGRKAWAGIAIGPNSEEAIVEVSGVGILQAGRIYPAAVAHAVVKRVRPIDSNIPINILDLVLFEDPAELAIGSAVARANASYHRNMQQLNAGGSYTYKVPFAGRRKAQVVFSCSSGSATTTYDYTVFGLKWNYVENIVVAYPLHSASNEWTQQGVGTVPDIGINNTYCVNAFYVGGTNEGEDWDALAIYVKNTGAAPRFIDCDVTLIGDSGTSGD